MWEDLGLDQRLVKQITEKLKLKSPTRVQTEIFTHLDTKTDLFVASRTGTGKTFGFVIPILNKMLQMEWKECDAMALVIAPTRELAMQIKKEFNRFKKLGPRVLRVCCLMGGMSREKQVRLLNKSWNVVVATVGRLKDLVESESSVGLKRLAMIRFLVVDEVDRLMELGQFLELKQILKYIDDGVLKSHETEIEGEVKSEEEEEEDLLQVDGPGGEDIDMDLDLDNLEAPVPGETAEPIEPESAIEELNEDLKALEDFEEIDDLEDSEGEEKVTAKVTQKAKPKNKLKFDPFLDSSLMIDGELIRIEDELEEEILDRLDEDELDRVRRAKQSRRTLLFSATLTSISSTSRMLSNKKLMNAMKAMNHNANQKKLAAAKEFPKIFDIMRQLRTNYKLKVINCTETSEQMFSENLEFMRLKCLPHEKILHLYYLLQQPENQLSIIFCNSISSSRKVLNVLKYCGVDGYGLHSHMQQRQRLKKIEQFRDATKRVVLVSTDVASRGLHIDNVNLVVHYHTPKDFDTFVHRSGRTARMEFKGQVVMLEDAHDRKRFLKFRSDLGSKQIQSKGINNKSWFQVCWIRFGESWKSQ